MIDRATLPTPQPNPGPRPRLPALENELGRLHAYEPPELTVVPITGSSAYLAWIEEAVRENG